MSSVSGSTGVFNNMIDQMGTASSSMEQDLRTSMQNMDPNDPKAMLMMQMNMQRYNLFQQLQSNVVKTMGEMVKNTISNIR